VQISTPVFFSPLTPLFLLGPQITYTPPFIRRSYECFRCPYSLLYFTLLRSSYTQQELASYLNRISSSLSCVNRTFGADLDPSVRKRPIKFPCLFCFKYPRFFRNLSRRTFLERPPFSSTPSFRLSFRISLIPPEIGRLSSKCPSY